MKEYLSFKNTIALIILGVGFPLFVTVLTSSIPSQIPNFETSNDWIGFFGSYTGAILGGIVTLIVMNATIKSSEENLKKATDENKRLEERRERIEFCNGIAELIASYCCESRKYRHQAKRIEKSSEDMVKLHKVFIKRKFDLAQNTEEENLSEKRVHLELSELEYKEAKGRLDEIVQQIQNINTVQLYFELNIKLKNIKDAKGLIEKLNIVSRLGGSSVQKEEMEEYKYNDMKFEVAIQDLMEETTSFIYNYTNSI